jgi:DNA-directed RNA polymerase specialized sigma24 family protein
MAVVMAGVRALVHRYGPELEPEEAAQEVMVRLLAMARAGGRRDPVQNPGAFITRVAQNTAIDLLRRSGKHRHEVPLDEEHLELSSEDELPALLHRSATHATVRAAIAGCLADRDFVTVRIVTVWLDLADELGHEPPSREVADYARVSHTTVNNALQRFRDRVADCAE